MLDDYTYGLQLAIEDVYEAKVHVFIYGHTRPNSPGWNIDVCLRPLIDKLTQLWSSGALTYDVSTKQNFQIKATLMWSINIFLVYGMVSDWSTYGKLTSSYCMENNKAFTLTKDSITSFFIVTSGFSQRS